MRFVWAVLAFVLAAVLIGTGIAQRTIFLGPKEVKAELSVDQQQRYTMIDGDVLRSHPGEQTLVARGDGPILAAQARTADLEAWLSDVSYNHVSLDKSGKPVSEVVEPKADAAASSSSSSSSSSSATDQAEAVRNPAASDLWLETVNDENALIDRMQLPEGVSVLVASDGSAPAPKDVVLSWPLDTATPWAGPLMVAGGAFMLLGLVLYVLAVLHSRRGRGPRRKGPPPMPPTEPVDVARRRTGAIEVGSVSEGARQGTTPPEPPARAERSASSRPRGRGLLVVPAIGLSAILLTGCSPDAWPQPDASPTASPSPTATPDANQQAPAMTEAQAARVLENVSKTLAQADETRDSTLAGTRLSGSALAERTTAYAVRGTVPDFALPPVIPADKIQILVPQAYDAWPRTTLMLVQHGSDDTVPPLILTMSQQDPWADYKVDYLSEMQASAKLPDMAPAWLGAKLAPPDSPFLAVTPDKLATEFADVIDNAEKSASYAKFDKTAVEFAATIQASRADLVQKLGASGASTTSSMSFDAVPGDDAPVAVSSITSGAVVAVTLKDVQAVAPTQAGVDIRLTNNPSAKALTGVESSAKGFTTTYGMQLFFSVPGQDSKEPITLLAATQRLLSVEVIP
ncbi:hypothetical protein J2Y69_000595 [Microbacterium resistens]|uniref:DUF8094 domain-containing protein n=1 Tax=Microbacterium resistens TaxID=156977 RepID=A0ABU1S8W8_9MICO|nr:glycosyl transferase [Microbacterium resistens]MDR6866010.1 hypothetical protein [Microbacterium resistens]